MPWKDINSFGEFVGLVARLDVRRIGGDLHSGRLRTAKGERPSKRDKSTENRVDRLKSGVEALNV